MTVTANTTRNQYSAGNQQNTYAYTFQIHDASDLKVYIGDELKSLNTHYTVTGVGSGTGGNVVFDLGVDGNGDPIYIPQDTVVSIFLAMDLDRDTNYQPSGAFLAADVNNDFDRLWIASNQQQTDINRSVRLQDTDADASMVLPKIADRANKLLAFSSVLSGATPVTINNNYAQWNSAYDNMITGMQLPSNGILRLSQQDGSDYTVDLDSRYHNIGIDIPDADISESSVTQHRTAMLDIPNNVKAKFGNGDELEIYSDGYTSVIKESGNGNLAILGDYLFLGNPDGTENYFTAQDGVGVGLYHNGTLKVSTSGDGISVSGTIQATGYNNTNWDTAYSWGDHSTAGYFTSFDITTQTDPKYLRADENDTTTGTLTAAGLIAGGLTYPISDGSANQVLVTDGNGTLSFANQSGGNGSSQWTTSGSDIYYNTGNVGIGTTSPSRNLSVNGTFGVGNGTIETIISFSDRGIFGTQSNHDLELRTNGSEAMRITSSGNVGIGTTSPVQLLEVSSNSSPTVRISNTRNDTDWDTDPIFGALEFYSFDGSGSGQSVRSKIQAEAFSEYGNATDLVLYSGNSLGVATEGMRIDYAGNVGIGTATPTTFNLSNGAGNLVVGSGSGAEGITVYSGTTSNGALCFADGTSSTDTYKGYVQYNHNTNSMQFATGHTERMRIDSTGNVGIGTTSPAQELHVVSSGESDIRLQGSNSANYLDIFHNASDFGLWGTGTQQLKLATNNTERLRIDSSGNVGIGTDSPDSALEVQGSVNGVHEVHIQNTFDDDDGTGDNPSAQLRLSAASNNGYIQCYGAPEDAASNHKIDIGSTAASSFLTFSPNNGEKMRIDSSGNLLVGTTNANLYDDTAGTGIALHANGRLDLLRASAANAIFNRLGTDGSHVIFRKDGTTVGSIGTISNDLTIGSTDTRIRFDDNGAITPRNSSDANSDATIDLGQSGGRFKDLYLSGGIKGNTLTLSGDGSNEHARVDSSGNVLVGKTASSLDTTGIQLQNDGLLRATRSGADVLQLNRQSSDGAIATFYKDGSTVGSIGSRAGLVTYITSGGTYSGLDFGTDINPMKSGALSDGQVNLGASGQRFLNLHLSGNVHTGDGTAASPAYTFGDDTDTGIFSPAADTIAFSEGGTEAMRISSSGNVGIGKTDPLRKIDMAYAKTADDTIGLRINNTATSYDGKVISVCKGASSAEQGVIGYADGFGLQSFYIAAGVAGLRCQTEFGSSPRLSPCNSSGTLRDNTTDLGASNARFDDIYATNTSIISTSDSTLKQDVETLTDAEERVAIACKGLLRKFRWRDAVAEKGDEARIHFGIMAQDLRDAFTAEGLDAHKYGMFCSNTWWEHEDEYYPTADSAPEGATEVTRMGVRYSELLAFIISAI